MRGAGLLLGAELDRPAPEVVDACRAAGVVVLSAGERVLRLAPPLTVTEDEVEHGLAVLARGAVVNRRERQGAILRLVREQPIATQSELAEALRDAGYDVVQTTVSRDINELGLIKVRAARRPPRLRAARGGRPGPLPRARRDRAPARALVRDRREHASCITTPRGFASPLAQAIDESGHPRVAGTIAGENTVFVVARDGTPAAQLRDELRTHLALTEGAA